MARLGDLGVLVTVYANTCAGRFLTSEGLFGCSCKELKNCTNSPSIACGAENFRAQPVEWVFIALLELGLLSVC